MEKNMAIVRTISQFASLAAFLSPPVGMSAHCINPLVDQMRIGDIYKGMYQFVALQVCIGVSLLISLSTTVFAQGLFSPPNNHGGMMFGTPEHEWDPYSGEDECCNKGDCRLVTSSSKNGNIITLRVEEYVIEISSDDPRIKRNWHPSLSKEEERSGVQIEEHKKIRRKLMTDFNWCGKLSSSAPPQTLCVLDPEASM
jgi:hypothetical protein